jgi:hypothetical protein
MALTKLGDQEVLLHGGPFGDDAEVEICASCHRYLSHDSRPPHSLANDLWVGDIPPELQDLHLPERLLIGLFIPAAHVVKLYPKQLGAHHWSPDSLYSGLRGNVSTFPLDQRQIADMLDIVKPPPLAILSATIAIAFVTPKGTPVSWLHGKGLPANFTVRRTRVANALRWLKANNPLYQNIEISEDRIASLPQNAVPDEIYQVVRLSDDLDGVHREHESYVPGHDRESGVPDFNMQYGRGTSMFKFWKTAT